jgi:hypothetical protein
MRYSDRKIVDNSEICVARIILIRVILYVNVPAPSKTYVEIFKISYGGFVRLRLLMKSLQFSE